MKIDAHVLNKAIDQVLVTRHAAELREAMVYGPPILAEIYNAYLKEMWRQEERQERHMRMAYRLAMCAGVLMVLIGLSGVLR